MLELAQQFIQALTTFAINGFELGLVIGVGYAVVRGIAAIIEVVKEKFVK
jgi:phage-related minor tail protein